MAQLQPGIPAKLKYKPLRYSHVLVKPGQDLLLTADPWSYLHGHLLRRATNKRSTNKANLERAKYYANLAEDFFRGGEVIDLPAKGTLLYYGMLNLVKCLLSTKGIPLETQVEHHGLTLTPSMKFELTVQPASKGSVNIFSEFASALGAPVKGKQAIKLQEVISHIPELHGVAHNLGFIRKPKFLPIEISLLTNESHSYLFSEVAFSKAAEENLPTHKFLRGERKDYFVEGFPCDGQAVFRSKSRKRINGESPVPFQNILKEYSQFNFASILTRNGYKYYCDLEPGSFHHLCYTLIMMFYIGTAARYRPSEVQEAMNGPLRPLVTEAVALCPRQFMYHIVSLITGQICVIPFSQI